MARRRAHRDVHGAAKLPVRRLSRAVSRARRARFLERLAVGLHALHASGDADGHNASPSRAEFFLRERESATRRVDDAEEVTIEKTRRFRSRRYPYHR